MRKRILIALLLAFSMAFCLFACNRESNGGQSGSSGSNVDSLTVYSISYELDGGTADNPVSYTEQDEIVLHNPIKSGYTFIGWTYAGVTEPELYVKIEKGSSGDKTFVAHYEVYNEEGSEPLKIAIFADVQLAGERNMSSTANAYLALKNHLKYAKSIGADVLLMSGDIVNNAIAVKDPPAGTAQSELEAYYIEFEHAVKEVYGNDESTYPEFFYNMGNHEWWDRSEEECAEAVAFFKKYARIESPNLVRQSAVKYYKDEETTLPTYYKVIKGVPFLAVSGEDSSGKIGSELKAEIKSWLEEIAELDSVKNGGPIYVSYHYPIPEVTYKGERAVAVCATIDELLKDYPSAIVFTGDTHFNGINERTINQVDYTSINIGTSSYSRHPGESATGYSYDNINAAGRGSITGDVGFKYEYTPTIMIAKTYSDKTVINRYFTADDPSDTKSVGIAWELTNTTDKEHFVYTNDRIESVEWANKLYGKDGLTFAPDAKVRYNVEGGKMMITFPDVTDYNYAEHYRIEVKSAANPAKVKYYDYLGHYYKQDDEPHIYSFVLENLPDATNYVVTVTAYDFFDNPCLAALVSNEEDETLAFADEIDIKTLDSYSDISKRVNYQVIAEGSNSSIEYYYRGQKDFRSGMAINLVIQSDASKSLKGLFSVTDWSEAELVFKVKNPNDFSLYFGMALVVDDNGKETWLTDFGSQYQIEVPANSDWTTVKWNFAKQFGITTDRIVQLNIKAGVPKAVRDTENGYDVSFYVDDLDIRNAVSVAHEFYYESKSNPTLANLFEATTSDKLQFFYKIKDYNPTDETDSIFAFMIFDGKDWANWLGYININAYSNTCSNGAVTITEDVEGWYKVVVDIGNVSVGDGSKEVIDGYTLSAIHLKSANQKCNVLLSDFSVE